MSLERSQDWCIRLVRVEQAFGVCENETWDWPVKFADSNPAPWARNNLAQHGAAGGVLGKVENRSESRRDGRGCFSRFLESRRGSTEERGCAVATTLGFFEAT